ncbi:uncharacterized protein N7496_002958 [Penicillium cataractarum]|uniref:Uncharacterized protein n=1 Tax=Penicillium cataractarum TaxID=2100454 RepID=A0A9W9VID1_9EURO|nr:uncharacterized protein N7496_002958 [Penicillium cataractarum]KAJ5380530.1 hypothetical protein N7496_002958 [Penicillium cataractarum]
MPRFTVNELSQYPPCPLRIIFAPPNDPDAGTVPDILALYRLYSLPGAFVSESLRDVAISFGTTNVDEGPRYTWFHFLYKSLPITDMNGVKRIKNQIQARRKGDQPEDFGWVHSAYCLIENGSSEVTLIIFNSEPLLYERFRTISEHTPYEETMKDPYCLLNVVFEILYERIDMLTWTIANVFTQEEMKILHMARDPELNGGDVDLPEIHMIQRHQIYLREAIESITVTLDATIDHQQRLNEGSTSISPSHNATQAGLRYRKVLIKSTDLRLRSMGKRTQNTINMAFNLVTQADSRVIKEDSGSMKKTAILTMIFLSCTAVAYTIKNGERPRKTNEKGFMGSDAQVEAFSEASFKFIDDKYK